MFYMVEFIVNLLYLSLGSFLFENIHLKANYSQCYTIINYNYVFLIFRIVCVVFKPTKDIYPPCTYIICR